MWALILRDDGTSTGKTPRRQKRSWTRSISCSWSTCSSLACMADGSSLISSRKSVPRRPVQNGPGLSLSAPVSALRDGQPDAAVKSLETGEPQGGWNEISRTSFP